MVNLKTFASSGKADTSGFVPYTNGTEDLVFPFNIHIDADDKALLLGDGEDSSLADNGSNMVIDTDVQSVGPTTDTRNLIITGAVINPIQQWAFGGTKSAAGGNVFRCALSGGRSETITKIEDGTEGQIITLIGNGVTTTLSEGVIVGDNLIVPGSSIVVGDTDTAQLVFDGTIGLSGKWVVISYSNNS